MEKMQVRAENISAKQSLEKRQSYIPNLKKREYLNAKTALSMSIEDHLHSYIQRKSLRKQGLREMLHERQAQVAAQSQILKYNK